MPLVARRLPRWVAPAVLVFLGLAGQSASAGTITTYTDRPTFNAAMGVPLTLEDFTPTDHFPISTGVLNSLTNLPGIGLFPGDIQPGVTYSTPIGSSFFFNIDGGGGYVGGFLDGFYGGDPNRVLTITFDNPASGFGFDTNLIMGTDFDITINFTSGPAYTANVALSGSINLEFFGFQSSLGDITSVIIDGNGSGTFAFALDNFAFDVGTAAAVPEPTSLTLAGLGLLSVYGWARRHRRS